MFMKALFCVVLIFKPMIYYLLKLENKYLMLQQKMRLFLLKWHKVPSDSELKFIG